jgi:hypothetical protein
MKMSRASLLLLAVTLFAPLLSQSQDTRQWIARFNAGLKKGACAAVAMASDDSGNVYVTGWANRSFTGVDIVTLKYSNNGQLMWSKFFAGPGAVVDKPTAIAVDIHHYAYVTGSSGGPNGLDYITIKYNIVGDTMWTQRYDGGATGGGDDVASAIAVNDSQNVFVTGWSAGTGTGFDFATLKYDSAGTLKFLKRYNGRANANDSALAIALRGNTELYVTGTSRDTVVWTDYTTIRYNPANGDSIWLARYVGPRNSVARAIAIRPGSPTDVFVTGWSDSAGYGKDIVTVHYIGTTGVEDWNARFNGSANGDDIGSDIAINGTSRVYVCGKSLSAGSAYDMITLKYNFNGVLGWSSTYDGPANDNDEAFHITGGANPYVVGPSAGAGVGTDFAIVQYAGGSGNEDLAVRFNSGANLDDTPADILTIGSNVYVTGRSLNVDKSYDIVTIKYTDLNKMKYRTFTQESLNMAPANLKVAASIPNEGNVRDAAMLRAYPKIKLGFVGYPGGMVLGKMRTDSPFVYTWIRFDKGSAVGKFVPQSAPTTGGFDLLGGKPMIKENKNPTNLKINSHLLGELAALKINIGASDAEITPPTFGDLTYDDNDTGNHYNGMTLRQIVSVIDNNLTYWKHYPPVNWPVLDSICTRVNRTFQAPSGSYVSKNPVTMHAEVQIDSINFLSPAITPLQNPLSFPPGSIASEIPESYVLYQNYPNPFNPTTTIQFDLPEASVVSLKIYDVLGREVATLLDNVSFEDGTQDISFDGGGLASGIYFYRVLINGGEHQLVKKMMLLK